MFQTTYYTDFKITFQTQYYSHDETKKKLNPVKVCFFSGEIQERGMVYPLTPHIYRPMLNRLRAEGIVIRETIEKIS